jgi:MYXO-CTERM domain-containing protein
MAMSPRAAVSSTMRRVAALFTFLLLVGVSTTALADIPPEKPKKSGKKSCSVSDDDGGVLGLAALALLLSGVAVRRRSP